MSDTRQQTQANEVETARHVEQGDVADAEVKAVVGRENKRDKEH